ncbi:hypothetical protein SGRA_2705 [Saprospira grandis str. Lewin]|uniref:Uncharacterized protein n=1 Tax=Saprospira grandis (strain Lewin) TaxID=984262 RepID=H6L9F7_SAPGL|nr:hypothetical protein SGRA_2705 [Saprospira grandis str. Lewin]
MIQFISKNTSLIHKKGILIEIFNAKSKGFIIKPYDFSLNKLPFI